MEVEMDIAVDAKTEDKDVLWVQSRAQPTGEQHDTDDRLLV
jgi:hypothetical protein